MIKKTITRRKAVSPGSVQGSIHPVLQRVYAARNVSTAAELDYSLNNLLSYSSLSNIDAAATLLKSALQQQKRIVIVADYDADGATACALAVRGLKAMGARHVQFIVPDRFLHGYGLSTEIVELASDLKPDLLITVDNGISSLEGVALARSRGMDVLITDHHIPAADLPDATVIVNPNLVGDSFPSKSLAGVGVMFYVLAALRSELRNSGWFAANKIVDINLAKYLDLVALGTVADVVQLDFNNRILVAQGLQRIREGRCVPGIAALLGSARRVAQNIVSSDLGFAIGPRLNAAGRLTDMRLGINCLITDDQRAALDMAQKLDQLNQERREIQAEMEEEALVVLDRVQLSAESLPHGMCLYQEHWHQGIIGVLASKMKDKTRRPVIAFAKETDASLKGSARSIAGVHIRDVLDAIASKHPGLLVKFGGHAMAAGLSLELKHFERFSTLFDEEVKGHIEKVGFDSELNSDGELAPGDFSISLAEEFKQAGPWGQGFPEPQFDGIFRILESRIVGDRHLKLQLCLEDETRPVEAIAFNVTGESWPPGCDQVQALYRLDVNDYRGRKTPQLIVDYIEPLSP